MEIPEQTPAAEELLEDRAERAGRKVLDVVERLLDGRARLVVVTVDRHPANARHYLTIEDAGA